MKTAAGAVSLALLAGSIAQGATQVPAPPPPTPAPEATPESRPAKVVLESSTVGGVAVHSLTIPWGPETFASMMAPGDSFYSKRTWPFARLATTVALEMDGARLPPGNYALVFHPNNMQNEGMRFEVLKIEAGEFLQEGNALTRTPPGESLLKVPVRFAIASTTLPTLKVGLTQAGGDGLLRLDVQYGDRTLARELKIAR